MLASLAFGKLAPEIARPRRRPSLAIDALQRPRARSLPEADRGDIQQVVANLQLAYADAAAPE